MSGNRKPQTFRDCAHCGRRFGPLPSLSQRFCSAVCKVEAQRGKASPKSGRAFPHLQRADRRACLTCREPFRATKDVAGIRAQRFCSRRCFHASREETTIERDVRAFLEAEGIRYRAQVAIGRKVVDFMIDGCALAIEVDGTYWHSLPAQAARDRVKDAALAALGISVARFPEAEVRKGREAIRAMWEAAARKHERAVDVTPAVA